MSLSTDLISQFVKATSDKKKERKEETVYGTVVVQGTSRYVRLDGSELLTPISTTADTKDGERVVVLIKNHTAIITGNLSSPAARTDDVLGMGGAYGEVIDKISEFEIIVADKVSTSDLDAATGRIGYLEAENVVIKNKLTANEAEITTLEADNVTIKKTLTANEAEIEQLSATKLDADVADIKFATIKNLDATNANIYSLKATYGEFEKLTTDKFEANKALIDDLEANKVSAIDIEGKFANIDFSNIGKATMEYFYASSGLIQNVTIGDATITGELVGVTISGDLIKGNTIMAEKLVIKGSDGLYYKLNTDGMKVEAQQTDQNSLNGQIIKAQSITATKINVNDLVAFGATIGGFTITDKSLYSGVKESVNNTTRGIHLDSTGQMSIGDASNFIKYFLDTDGKYKLAISASSMKLSSSNASVEDEIEAMKANAITNVDIEYALSPSKTVEPTTGWSKVAPTWIEGRHMWQRTVSIYGDDSVLYSNAICLSGPPPSNMATTNELDRVQNAANAAQSTADANESRIMVSESTLELLSNAISTLVTDENGNSMMTQTSSGWTFNLSSIEDTLDRTASELNDMSGSMAGLDNMMSNLNTLVNDLGAKTSYIVMTADEGGNPCIELGKEDNEFKVRITNTSVDFMEGSSKIAYVNNKSLYIERAIIKDELQIGEGNGFVWKKRSNGNLGLRWMGE